MSDVQATACIFCRIAAGELNTPFVAENEHAVAFRDLQPQAPTHVLVVPRRHLASLQATSAADSALLSGCLALAVDVAKSEHLLATGYRVLTNDGPDAGQTVFHLHFHVLGGKPLATGLA